MELADDKKGEPNSACIHPNVTIFYFAIFIDNGGPIGLHLNQTTQIVLPSTDNEISSPKLCEPRHLFSLQRELGPQQVEIILLYEMERKFIFPYRLLAGLQSVR